MKNNNSWKMRLIESLGLSDFLIRNFLYRPPQLSYTFEKLPLSQEYIFYPIFKDKKIDVSNSFIEQKAFILKHNCYVPILYLYRHHLNLNHSSPSQSNSNSIILEQFDPKRRRSNSQPPQETVPKQQNKLLVLYSHGNASDLGDVFFFGEKMVKQYDVDFLAYDYSGYGLGLNKYLINEKQTYEDLQNVLAFAVAKLHYQLSQIILWGFSLGSGPTVEIASRYSTIGGVVLQAPLASVISWVENGKCNEITSQKDIYSNICKIQAIKSKILLIHGEKDSIISIKHSQFLYDKYNSEAQDPQNIWFIQVAGMDHNDLQELIEDGDCELSKKVFRFFRDVDMDRTCLQLSQLNGEWPEEELMKLQQKKEQSMREIELLSLIAEDFTRDQAKPTQSRREEEIVKPVEELTSKKDLTNNKKKQDLRILDYRAQIQRKMVEIKEISKDGKKKENRNKWQKFCICSDK